MLNETIEQIARDICKENTICTCQEKDGHCHSIKMIAERLAKQGYKPQKEYKTNTNRERLIELLIDAEIGYAQYLSEECDKVIKGEDIVKQLMNRLEFYADYLLKHNIESIIKCNVLKLRKEKFPLLFSKKKTSTCRQGIRHININDNLKFIMTEDETFSIDVTVTNVKYIKYSELTEEEAIKEGYTSLKELQDTLKTLYTINDNDDFTIIEFVL